MAKGNITAGHQIILFFMFSVFVVGFLMLSQVQLEEQFRGTLIFFIILIGISSSWRQTSIGAAPDAESRTEGSSLSDPTDRMFDPNHLLKIEINIPEEDWDQLRVQRHDLASFHSEQRLDCGRLRARRRGNYGELSFR